MPRLHFKPLYLFFFKGRHNRFQVGLFAFFVVYILFLSLVSPAYRDNASLRIGVSAGWLVFLWPIWVMDERLRPNGPIGLFIAARHSLKSLVSAYFLARFTLFAIFGVLLTALLVNTSALNVTTTLIYSLLTMTICGPLVMMPLVAGICIFFDGKRAVALSYFVFFLLMTAYQKAQGLSLYLLSAFFPGWIFDYEDVTASLLMNPFKVLEVVPAVLLSSLTISAIYIYNLRGRLS